MPELVALDLAGDPTFVETAFVRVLQEVWAAGDAVFVLDPRLPDAEQRRVLTAMAPSAIIGADGERRRLDSGIPTEPGDALVVPTSGTTGQPKGVVLTHDAIAASAEFTSQTLAVDPATDRWLACLPLAHIGGLSVVTRSVVTGTEVEVHAQFDATAAMGAAERGATLVSLVTRAWAQIPDAPFRRVVLGGAAPPSQRPAHVHATYGMTETGSGVVYDQIPIGDTEIRIEDPDLHGEGEIWLRGSTLLRAYRDGTDPFVDGWLPTGDLGSLDESDRLSVRGRRGEVIVTGGEKVWPSRAEEILNAHPAIDDVALIGRPHPEWGQQVVALIVPAPHAAVPPLGELRDLVKTTLPVWYAPTAIEVCAALPRTALGKLQRTRLR